MSNDIYVDPLIYNWYDQPFQYSELVTIIGSKAILTYIPDEFQGVVIDGMYFIADSVPDTSDKFTCNFQNGSLTFHSSTPNNTKKTVNYYARGVILTPANRVHIQDEGNLINSDNLESALQETITKVNNVQTQINQTRYKYGSFIRGGAKVDTVAKTVEILSSTIITDNGSYFILPVQTITYIDPNNRAQYVYFDTGDQSVKIYENGTMPNNKNLILLFSFYNGKVGDSFTLSAITIDGNQGGGWRFNGDPLTSSGVISASQININTSTMNIELGTGGKSIIVKNKSYSLGSTAFNIDIKGTGANTSGWLYYNTLNNTFFKASTSAELATITPDHARIGVFTSTSFHLNSTGFTVDGKWYVYGKPESSATNQAWIGSIMNCLGDSITEGNTTYATEPYHTHFAELCGFATVRNYGVAGTRVQVSPGRTDSFLERYEAMDNNADVISVFGGVNDWWSNLPLGTFSDRVNNTFYGALHLLYTGLIQKYPNKLIITFTPLKFYREGVAEVNTNGNTLEQFAQAVREVSDHYSLPLFDLRKYSSISGLSEHITLYLPDGVHPNNNGHKRIATKMAGFLNAQ